MKQAWWVACKGLPSRVPVVFTSKIQLVPLHGALSDVLRSLFGPQCPGDVAAVADLVICCHKRDLPLSLKLTTYLTRQSLLFGLLLRRMIHLHRQQETGPLFHGLLKNGF